MNIFNEKISLQAARLIAARNAYSDLKDFCADEENCLEPGELEAEACWMFFPDRAMRIPPEARLGLKWAYVVSKRGTFSLVQDLSDDPARLLAYIGEISAHFKERGE